MNYIKPKEIKNLEASIHEMVQKVDPENPLTVIALANTLIQIGNNIMSGSSSQLITRAYAPNEIKEFKRQITEEIMNPMNKELHETRTAIEHYERIIREDMMIGAGELEDDGRPKLSQEDIDKIKSKIKGLTEKRDELLKQDKDYVEVN